MEKNNKIKNENLKDVQGGKVEAAGAIGDIPQAGSGVVLTSQAANDADLPIDIDDINILKDAASAAIAIDH